MKVKVIYRNYIPLYSGYCSFWLYPVKGVEVVIPEVKRRILLFRIYRSFRGWPLFSLLVKLGQKIFFKKIYGCANEDLLFYTGMLPLKNPKIPYVIDFEHVHSLFDYASVDLVNKEKVWCCLNSIKCIGILPWSLAALNTLKMLYKNRYKKIESKVTLLYPALPVYKDIYAGMENFECVPKSSSIKFLFVGRDYKRKGLMELLEAFQMLCRTCNDIELYIVSNINKKYEKKYINGHIHYYDAKFSQEEIIKKFFLTGDVLVMPTHVDTFGMVLLEALSSGMPVITTDQFASKEIVESGVNGLLVKSEKLFLDEMLIPDKRHTGEGYNEVEKVLVDDIFLKMKYILDNPDVLKLMKRNSIKQFEEGGKFSISERNRKLKIIYEKIYQKQL